MNEIEIQRGNFDNNIPRLRSQQRDHDEDNFSETTRILTRIK